MLLTPPKRKGRRTRRGKCSNWRLWISKETYMRLMECVYLARLVEPTATVDDVLNRAMVAHGIQVRRRLRAAGKDVEAELAKLSKGLDKPSRGFDGVPEKPSPRVYDY